MICFMLVFYMKYRYIKLLVKDEALSQINPFKMLWEKLPSSHQFRSPRAESPSMVQPSEQPIINSSFEGVHWAAWGAAELLQQAGCRHHPGTLKLKQEIDWASWKSKIITEGLVDRVKQNY